MIANHYPLSVDCCPLTVDIQPAKLQKSFEIIKKATPLSFRSVAFCIKFSFITQFVRYSKRKRERRFRGYEGRVCELLRAMMLRAHLELL